MDFLRLRPPVDAVSTERLRADLPLRAGRVLARVAQGRTDHSAETRGLGAFFAKTCQRLGLAFAGAGDDRANTPPAGPIEARTFRRPARAGDQRGLFGER